MKKKKTRERGGHRHNKSNRSQTILRDLPRHFTRSISITRSPLPRVTATSSIKVYSPLNSRISSSPRFTAEIYTTISSCRGSDCAASQARSRAHTLSGIVDVNKCINVCGIDRQTRPPRAPYINARDAFLHLKCARRESTSERATAVCSVCL